MKFVIRGITGQLDLGTPDPDTLIVQQHANVNVNNATAITLDTSGLWTVQIDGSVRSAGASPGYGIDLPFGANASAKIAIGATGKVSGGAAGIGSFGSTLSITNHGTISGGNLALDLSDFKDTVVNSGKIIGGISTYGQDDVVTNFQKMGHTIVSGTITGVIDLGINNDTFRGGAKAETVRDAPGADQYLLGGGNDTYLAVTVVSGPSLETDSVNGGKGIDTYSMGGSSLALGNCQVCLISPVSQSSPTYS